MSHPLGKLGSSLCGLEVRVLVRRAHVQSHGRFSLIAICEDRDGDRCPVELLIALLDLLGE